MLLLKNQFFPTAAELKEAQRIAKENNVFV